MTRYLILTITVILALLLLGACSDDSSTGPTTGNPNAPQFDLFDVAREVAPSFSESSAKSDPDLGEEPEPEPWNPDDPLAQLYNRFREFDPAIHGGVLDGSNLFASLYDMNLELERAFEHSEPINPMIVEEPFEFGNSETYDHGAALTDTSATGTIYQNGWAYREDGDVIHYLVVFNIAETSTGQVTTGQLQGWYDNATGDLDMGMVYLVDYGRDNYYVVRNEIAGNDSTHAFELRMATYGGPAGLGSTIVGKGISQGDGTCFLVRMNMGDGLVGEGERYYVIPSNADEATLQAMDGAGFQYADLPQSVDMYKQAVHDMVLFMPTDLPASLEDFDSGGMAP